jgi:hypothetical protein
MRLCWLDFPKVLEFNADISEDPMLNFEWFEQELAIPLKWSLVFEPWNVQCRLCQIPTKPDTFSCTRQPGVWSHMENFESR